VSCGSAQLDMPCSQAGLSLLSSCRALLIIIIIVKKYTLLKQKRKSQNPKRLKKENLTFKQVWAIGKPWLEYQIINNKNFMFYTICKKANINNSI
jgi:hypothetical protein